MSTNSIISNGNLANIAGKNVGAYRIRPENNVGTQSLASNYLNHRLNGLNDYTENNQKNQVNQVNQRFRQKSMAGHAPLSDALFAGDSCFRRNDEVENWNDGVVGNNPYRLSKFSKLGKFNKIVIN